MDINTIFNAVCLSSIYSSYGPPQQHVRENRRLCHFRAWLLRHEEKQRKEIAELSTLLINAQKEIARLIKLLSTERSLLDNAPVWAAMNTSQLANCPPDTMIGIRYEQIQKWQAEIARFNSEIAQLKNNEAKITADILVERLKNMQFMIDIARLQAQIAAYESIVASNIEDSHRVGDSAKPYMNER